MAYSKLILANLALDLVRGQPLSNFDTDNTASAVLIRRHFDQVLKRCLLSGFWRFSMKRVASPTADVTAPVNEYEIRYALPSDFLRMAYVLPQSVEYVIEDGFILTYFGLDGYVYQDNSVITNITQLSDVYEVPFADYFCAELAKAVLPQLAPQDATLRRELDMLARERRAIALATHAMEETPQKPKGSRWDAFKRYGGSTNIDSHNWTLSTSPTTGLLP